MVNNHNPRQADHHKRPTVKANIFPFCECLIIVMLIENNHASDQEAQTHVSIIEDSFGIILELTCYNRGRVRDGPQQQTKFPVIWTSHINFVHWWQSRFRSKSIIKTSFVIIIEVTRPVFVFIDDKYAFNQDDKYHVWIVKNFISIFIKVGQ